jgi:hypothetical protein
MSAAGRRSGPGFSPPAYWAEVEPAAAQAELRRAFGRWGLPGGFRLDNGIPWGSAGDLPTDLALWLIGLGIDLTFNPPARPDKNGVVERSQGTGKRWAEPWTCRTPAELQRHLDKMDRLLREEYPSVAGRSRQAAFPGLAHSGHPYSKGWERRAWDLDKVLAHLAEYAVVRRVDKSGMVSLYNRTRYVGKAHAGKDIFVLLDPLRREWIFADTRGQQLRSQAAEEICRERILSLTVTHRR